jgi:secondary thiamine-phosphate synthase enzyme
MFAKSPIHEQRLRTPEPRHETDTSTFYRVIELSTECAIQFKNITDQLRDAVTDSHIQCGVVHVQSLHTTLAVFVGEWQDALLQDVEEVLRLMVPDGRDWRHNDPRVSDCDRGNATAQLRAMLLGQTMQLQVRDGRPVLGTWQRLIVAELDGPRTRQVSIQVGGD